MNLGLEGRVALIGGSSKGLGKGCAIQLAKEGVDVAICSRGTDSLNETADFIRDNTDASVLAVQTDLSKKEDIKKLVEKTIKEFGKIDILVNNSGGPPPGTFFDFTEENWQQAYESLLLYAIRSCYLVIPYMKKHKWGRIINLTSTTVKEPAENLILSNVFRVGVVSLAKTMTTELVADNITINNICTGAFKTDRCIDLMNNNAKIANKSVDEIEEEIVAGLPLKRFQTPAEMGDLVAFLCSELAGGITGTTIQIDGGMSKCLF